jgi:lambda repressor-like predicted transcriptional regulator
MSTADLVRERCEAIPLAVEARADAIAQMRAEGATLRAIAEAAGISHAAVAKILAKRP